RSHLLDPPAAARPPRAAAGAVGPWRGPGHRRNVEITPEKVIEMATVATPHVPSYPVHVDARPVPDHPSRWLWLVKWVLVIPHVLVLALLWAAFVVLSVVALVAILAT